MRSFHSISVLFIALFVTACATPQQTPLPFAKDSWTQASGQTVGIYIAHPEKPTTYLDGAECLLCIAAAAAANNSLTSHTETLPLNDLDDLKKDLATELQKQGVQVKMIDKKAIDLNALQKFSPYKPNFAYLDFRPLKNQLNVQKLLIVDVTRAGFVRTYAGYVPTSDPKATLVGNNYMVDLSTNAYNWYQSNKEIKASTKGWDEPPKFPRLSNAFFEVLEQYKDRVLSALKP